MDPTAQRIDLPQGYGDQDGGLAAVQERLEQAPRYWLVTLGRDGRAHAVPVDGLAGRRLVVSGHPATLHQRDLEHDQRVVVHLEDTMAAVILEGSMRRTVPPPELARRPGRGPQGQVRPRLPGGGLRRRPLCPAPAPGPGRERLPRGRHPVPVRLTGDPVPAAGSG